MSSIQQFSAETPTINHLLEEIENGKLGLPDLQRPFVWNRTKIRDLLDSLYKGFPSGYFLFWETPKDVESHSIGSETNQRPQQKMIVDGQQRLTSLFSVLKGKKIINADNEEQLIQISFNPLTEEFAVRNSSSEKNPFFITNISEIWISGIGSYDYINKFLEKVSKNKSISEEEKNKIARNIQKLENIQNYKFSVLVLSETMEIDTVAEVFQRINSNGIPLNSADFILTLMSVYWVEGRHKLEDFCRSAKTPANNKQSSSYNVFHSPSPDQMLRVAIGLGLKRGVLQNAYQILRGKDPESNKVKSSLRDARFNDLKIAQEKVLDLNNWHEFMICIKIAGFRSKSMLTSSNNFLYSYLLFLLGKFEYSVDNNELRKIISKWFFMCSLTGRYTGSPESVLEADIRRLDMGEKKPSWFVEYLDSLISSQFIPEFWEITLPQKFDNSGGYSPYLFGYHAALNLLGATALFSGVKISEILDPAVSSRRSLIERHHLFPKSYLRSVGINGIYSINQIANYAFLEWDDNNKISDKPPSQYFPQYFSKLSENERKMANYWHALPDNWENMEYWKFIKERRRLISLVIKDSFKVLNKEKEPLVTYESLGPSVSELLKSMETSQIEFKSSARVSFKDDIPEKVVNESVIKTIAAFMNSDGGTLAIGISDDGDILGLEQDLNYKNQDLDQYQNWLSTLMMNRIGKSVIANLVQIRFETLGDKLVCLVDVKKSNKPVFANNSSGDETFYVRVGNSTRILKGREITDYTDK